MKALLDAIRSALLASPAFSYLHGRVYVAIETADAVFFPTSFLCPCIVLNPGATDIKWLPAMSKDEKIFIQLSTYRYFRDVDDALLGTGNEMGILEMTDTARLTLEHVDLGLNYDENGEILRIEQPEPFELTSQDETVIRQNMTLIYSKFQH